MSDSQVFNFRRKEDERISEIEESLKQIGDDVGTIKTKIFNGFGESIKNTNQRVNDIDKLNNEQHKEIKDSILKLSDKMDKMLWAISIGMLGIFLTIVIKDFLS